MSSTIEEHGDKLVDILGAPLLDELKRIFYDGPGPTLRHDVAHGKLWGCESVDVIYACWLLYRVCCLFKMEKWDECVRPLLPQR